MLIIIISILLILLGFLVVKFGLRVLGLFLGAAAFFLVLQILEIYLNLKLSPWIFLAAAAVGGIIGIILVPLFAEMAVIFFAFLFGCFLPEILPPSLVPWPHSSDVLLIIRLVSGIILAAVASRYILQIAAILTALLGSAMMAKEIQRPKLFFLFLAVGLVCQSYLIKRTKTKTAPRSPRAKTSAKGDKDDD
ncbi:MAG: hypothetical protein PHE84_05830 [bacterium]|nr:hypothetical protein [bacterium]